MKINRFAVCHETTKVCNSKIIFRHGATNLQMMISNIILYHQTLSGNIFSLILCNSCTAVSYAHASCITSTFYQWLYRYLHKRQTVSEIREFEWIEVFFGTHCVFFLFSFSTAVLHPFFIFSFGYLRKKVFFRKQKSKKRNRINKRRETTITTDLEIVIRSWVKYGKLPCYCRCVAQESVVVFACLCWVGVGLGRLNAVSTMFFMHNCSLTLFFSATASTVIW